MSLSLVAPAKRDDTPKPFALTIMTADIDPTLVAEERDDVLLVRTNAPLIDQMWAIEEYIKSLTGRPYTSAPPKLSEVTR